MRDWARAFVESPLAGAVKFHPGPSQVRVFDGERWIFIANVRQEQNSEYNVWDKIEPEGKYPTICPHCGAPHNPKEARCEYCGGYMKEE